MINPATNTVVAVWPTAPAESPHGLILDPAAGRLFSAGGDSRLVAFDLKMGKVVSAAIIAPGTDHSALDPKRRRLYCASRGFVSVVQVTAAGGLRPLGGAHTLALDPATGDVWVSYSDGGGGYLQRFSVSK